MSISETAHGISNGHWEHTEPRTAWLVLLARLGVVELCSLGDLARTAAIARNETPLELARRTDTEAPIAAE